MCKKRFRSTEVLVGEAKCHFCSGPAIGLRDGTRLTFLGDIQDMTTPENNSMNVDGGVDEVAIENAELSIPIAEIGVTMPGQDGTKLQFHDAPAKIHHVSNIDTPLLRIDGIFFATTTLHWQMDSGSETRPNSI